jgi:PAS domain S-box-containing protein
LNNSKENLADGDLGYFDKVIICIDESGEVFSAEKATRKVLGYTEEELKGLEWCDNFVPERAREQVFKNHQRLTNGGESHAIHDEHPVITKKGEERAIFWHKSPIVGKEEETAGISLVGVDVTGSKSILNELEKLEKDYRALLHGIKDAVFIHDTEGNFLAVNKEATRKLGYSEEELLKRTPKDIDASEQKKKVNKRLHKIIDRGELKFESVHLTKDEKEIPVEVSSNLIRFHGKKAILSVARDISERKKAYRELERSQREQSVLLSNLPGIAYKCRNDDERTMEFVSQGCTSLTGYQPGEITDNEEVSYGDLILDGDRERVLNKIKESVGNKEPFTVEYRIHNRSGIIKWVREQGEAVFDGNGDLKNIQGFITSISKRKKAEIRLSTKEKKLEQSFIELAETTSRVLGVRDPYTQEHEQRVAELSQEVGRRFGLSEKKLVGLYLGGVLHDIGKIAIPETILTKPGELKEVEWEIIRSHPEVGYNQILKDTNFPWPVAEMTLHHHERLNGSGYPDGLEGDELTQEVRIIGTVDVVEAMSTRRPYRPPRSKEETLNELNQGKGTKYDPEVVEALKKMIDENAIKFS